MRKIHFRLCILNYLFDITNNALKILSSKMQTNVAYVPKTAAPRVLKCNLGNLPLIVCESDLKQCIGLFAVLLALRKAIIGFIWHYATLSFGRDDEKEEKSGIYAASYYDFEENTGIDFNHASSVFQCFQNMTAEMMTEEVYEDLLANQNNYDVKFTGTENIGIVHVIAKIMTSKPHIINSHSQQTIKDFGVNDLIHKRLVIELACHIKMRRKGIRVCLTQYNEYLYSSDDFKRHKKRLMEIEDLNARAIEENKILTRMHTYNVLNGLYSRFARAIYKHRGPYIDQSKVCMNGINGFDRTFDFLNADYNHITESLDEFYNIIEQCQLGSHNKADEQKVHENYFQTDFHKPISTLELNNALKIKHSEVILSMNALNCRFSGMQGQPNAAFSVDDADEKVFKIFQAKFDKIVKTYDDMSVKIVGHRKEHIKNFSRLAVLDKYCREMFKRIERCILVLSKGNLVPDNANIDTDIYPVKILVRICAFKKCNKAIHKVVFELKELRKEMKTLDMQLSSLLYEIGNVQIVSEFLLSKTEYESLQNRTDMNIDAKVKMENLAMYILNLIDSLKRQLSLEIEAYTRKGIEADYLCRKMSKNNLRGSLNLELSSVIGYVREIFANDKLLEVFNEFICTFCETLNTEANLLEKQYQLKNSTSSTPEFKELLYEYYKFALEVNARRNDKQLETSEIFLTLIQSKYCIFKLRKNITFISGKMPGDDILVNLLSDKMFMILGTFYASNQYLYREDKEYKKVDNIIIEKLGKQAFFLIETETLRQSIDSSLVLSRNSDNNADVDTVSTALSDFTNAKIEVENILVKQSDQRAQRYQSREKDVADGKNCCDEQEQNTLHIKKTDRCILLEKNLDEVNKIIDNLYADTKKIVHKNTIAQDIKHDSFCIDSDLNLLKSIKKVYEEDLKIVCYKSHLKLAEDQRTKYYNEMQQNHQIASLATRDTGILDLAIDLMISHGNKMQLMEIINKVTLCPEQTFGNPAVAASQSIKTVKTEHVRTLSNGSTISLDKYRNVGNAIDCFRQFYAINLSIFDSKRRETAKQNHSCDPTSADLQSILIFIDVYLKRKELLSVRKNENMSKETFDAYKSWLKRLGAVCISSTKEIDYKMSRILEVQTVQMQQITQKKQQPSTPSVSKNQSTAVLDLHQSSQNHVAVDDASFFGQNKARKIILISGIAVVIVFGVICGLYCLTKRGYLNL